MLMRLTSRAGGGSRPRARGAQARWRTIVGAALRNSSILAVVIEAGQPERAVDETAQPHHEEDGWMASMVRLQNGALCAAWRRALRAALRR